LGFAEVLTQFKLARISQADDGCSSVNNGAAFDGLCSTTNQVVNLCIAKFVADGVCKAREAVVIVQGNNKKIGSTNTVGGE